MAKATEITVDVKVKIPDDTVLRCIRLLEMWMDDNPHKTIICTRNKGETGYHHSLRIKDEVVQEP